MLNGKTMWQLQCWFSHGHEKTVNETYWTQSVLPARPSWWQLLNEDASVLRCAITFTVSVPYLASVHIYGRPME